MVRASACRWCRGKIEPPRRTFCSNACVHEHRLRSNSGYRRDHVFKRDGGVCAECGRDCHVLERDLLRLLYEDPSKLNAELARLKMRRRAPAEVDHRRGRYDAALVASLRGEELVDMTLPAWEPGLSLWHADHVLPVAEGGGSVGPEALRTLCLWCHKKKTAEQARRRALAKQVPPPDDLFPDDPDAPPDWLFGE